MSAMITPEPIKLSDIDNYLEDLTAIAEKANGGEPVSSRAHGRFRRGAESNTACEGEVDFSFLP